LLVALNGIFGTNLSVGGKLSVVKSSTKGIATLAAVSGNVAIDADESDIFEFDAVAATAYTIQNPTNPNIGRKFTLRIKTSNSGASIIWGSDYDFLSIRALEVDSFRYLVEGPFIDFSYVGYWYFEFSRNEHNSKWDCTHVNPGFAILPKLSLLGKYPYTFKLTVNHTSFTTFGGANKARLLLTTLSESAFCSNIRADWVDPEALGLWSGGTISGASFAIGWVDESDVFHPDYLDSITGPAYNGSGFPLKAAQVYLELTLATGTMAELAFGVLNAYLCLSHLTF
jgi:hypothetical protein